MRLSINMICAFAIGSDSLLNHVLVKLSGIMTLSGLSCVEMNDLDTSVLARAVTPRMQLKGEVIAMSVCVRSAPPRPAESPQHAPARTGQRHHLVPDQHRHNSHY